jgi:transketolase C-terminal domain/subunit
MQFGFEFIKAQAYAPGLHHRLTRSGCNEFVKEGYNISVVGAETLNEGKDIAFACGLMVDKSIKRRSMADKIYMRK